MQRPSFASTLSPILVALALLATTECAPTDDYFVESGDEASFGGLDGLGGSGFAGSGLGGSALGGGAGSGSPGGSSGAGRGGSAGTSGAAQGGGAQGGAAGACNECTSDCTTLYYGDRPYRFCSTALTQPDAAAECAAAGMSLAAIEDGEENAWIRTTMRAEYQGPHLVFFLGASDADQEGDWAWGDGAVFWRGESNGNPQSQGYAAWDDFQPNDSVIAGTEDCLIMAFSDGMWSDIRCDLEFPFICEGE
jgi:hypothetical protein